MKIFKGINLVILILVSLFILFWLWMVVSTVKFDLIQSPLFVGFDLFLGGLIGLIIYGWVTDMKKGYC